MKRPLHSQGFTLIEIIIVLAVIILMTGATIPYINQFTDRRRLEDERIKLLDVLSLARKKAQASEQGTGSCSVFMGYSILLNSDEYSMNRCCDSSCSTPQNIHTYSLPSGLSVSTNNESNIVFRTLTGTTTMSGNTVITVRNASDTCSTITVHQSGLIEQGTTQACP